MFRFAHPEYLNAFYLIPVLILVFWFLSGNRNKILERFADKKLHRVLLPFFSKGKNIIKFSLILLSFALLIIAAANPQVGSRIEEVKQTGIDVYILLDVSNSMLAEDIKPNRLEKAKLQISNLINRLKGDRIGLVVFAGEAFVQFPITTDYSAANLFLSAADNNSVTRQGTAIAAAINLADKSFDYSSSTEKVMIIITDGEDHEGDVNETAEKMKAKGIKIYTIGLGSPEGVPIPIYNQGAQVGFKQDREGKTVLTRLDEDILKKIASITGGQYYRGSNYEDYLEKIYDDLSQIKKAEYGVKKVTDYENRFYYFLFLAILLLIIEFLIPERKSPWMEKIKERLGIA
ncbi:MAG TPA: VWA domain-containing protein [Ignavibacteriaceae bacterium]|nr:VWA domain-containing protein [Ignavibacteriaceae bacterium]